MGARPGQNQSHRENARYLTKVNLSCGEQPKKMTKKLIITYLQYLPLTVFLLIGYGGGDESIENWMVAWKISCLLSMAAVSIVKYFNIQMDWIFFSANLFLLIGGVLAWFGFGAALSIYGGMFRGVALFSIMSVVGLLATFCLSNGYINTEGDRSIVRSRSLMLLAATVAAGLISYVFRENRLMEGVVPFTCVYFYYLYLQKGVQKS